MKKLHLRDDKTCRNCRHVVAERFCPNCGQENIRESKSFHHLFTHFVEDLVHYDSSFWKTIRALLFRPGQLTICYLEGKRKTFVPPAKLYIFINFLAFFLVSMIITGETSDIKVKSEPTASTTIDTTGIQFGEYATVRELDSAEAAKPDAEKLNAVQYWIVHKMAKASEKSRSANFQDRIGEEFVRALPKALFLYMPLFAFGLWLMHGKRRWYYFDHGIFTLHYFSFLLLTFSLFLILTSITELFESDVLTTGAYILSVVLLCWWFFYFFRSHRRFYGEKRWISRTKGLILFIVNMFLILILLLIVGIYSSLNIR